ncbi:MAG: hypothetical protein LAO09_17370 [Acidobacteriia bacterium]|nr:hypothetical protein [Terriglobia bacterium]
MQSVNVGDGQKYAAGVYPTSRENWAHNFRTYPAPVHHLQTNAPGTKFLAEGYRIDYITVNDPNHPGEATIFCTSNDGQNPSDCSWLSGQQIYISGNTNNALNGVWLVNCDTSGTGDCSDTNEQQQCTTNRLSFCAGASLASGSGGIVWGPDYWPVVMPFAVQHGVTSIEVWECSLDYAFGANQGGFTTTQWVSDSGGSAGCADWGVIGGQSGADLGYQNTLGDTRIGQPTSTSVRAGQGTFVNGSQF